MKKVFFMALAAAAMVSCSNDEVVDLNREAIGFGDNFVENSTRAAADSSYGANTGQTTLTAFQIWGSVKGEGATAPVVIFDGDNVTKGDAEYNAAWTCDGADQYWIPGADYVFVGIVDGNKSGVSTVNLVNGMPSTISYTADGATDLLCETITRKDDTSLVSFTFNHLLSKVKFTVNNEDYAATNYKYYVKNITITNAYAVGVYNIASKAWDDLSGTLATGQATTFKLFGDIEAIDATQECASEKLLLPGLPSVTVDFDLELYHVNGSESLVSKEHKTVSATITDGMKAAFAYDFNINVSIGNKIEFSVKEQPAWTNATPDINL